MFYFCTSPCLCVDSKQDNKGAACAFDPLLKVPAGTLPARLPPHVHKGPLHMFMLYHRSSAMCLKLVHHT